MPESVEDVSLHQKEMPTDWELLDTSSSKRDNLINDMSVLDLATKMVDNDDFHLNQMLKQLDKNELVE